MKRYYLIIPIALFTVDRIIKYFIPRIILGDDFVTIGLYKNYAGAFSLPIAGTVYNIVGIILLTIFTILFYKELKTKTYPPALPDSSASGGRGSLRLTAYGFIILGGISNIFDRLYFGYVIDYVQVMNRSFFNLADVVLIGGVAILLVNQIRLRSKKF